MAEGKGGALRELLVYFGVEVEADKLKAFEGGLGSLVEKAKHAAGALAGFWAGKEIKEFFAQTIEQGAAMNDLAEKLGMGTEEIQKFQYAAGLAGVDAQSAAVSLGFLNKAIGGAIEGGKEQAEVFRSLGIKLKDGSGQVRETGDVLIDLADAFKNMQSHPERVANALKLFGKQGAALVPLLKEGSEGVAELYAEFDKLGGLMSEDFIKASDEVDDELAKVRVAFNGLRVRLVQVFLPVIQKLATFFKELGSGLNQLAQRTNTFGHALSMVKVAAFTASLIKLLPVMKQIAVEGLLDAAPWLIWAIAIAAVVLVVEDLMTLLDGGKSVIGDFIEAQDGVKGKEQFVKDLRDAWKEFGDSLKELMPDLKVIVGDLLKLAVMVAPALAFALRTVVAWLDNTAKLIHNIINGIKELANGDWGDALADLNPFQREGKGRTGAGHAEFNENGGGLIDNFTGEALAAPAVPPPRVTNWVPGFTGPIQSVDVKDLPLAPKVEITNHNTIQVTGGSDPKETGKKVGEGISNNEGNQLRNALNAVKTR